MPSFSDIKSAVMRDPVIYIGGSFLLAFVIVIIVFIIMITDVPMLKGLKQIEEDAKTYPIDSDIRLHHE